MALLFTPKTGNPKASLRALALLFLTLCLLVSCPLKRELRAAFLEGEWTAHPAAAVQQARHTLNYELPADLEQVCAKAVQAILDEAAVQALSEQFNFNNPVLFLAISLAGLYVLLAGATGKTTLHNAFPGGVLAAKIPLFLRYRQLVI